MLRLLRTTRAKVIAVAVVTAGWWIIWDFPQWLDSVDDLARQSDASNYAKALAYVGHSVTAMMPSLVAVGLRWGVLVLALVVISGIGCDTLLRRLSSARDTLGPKIWIDDVPLLDISKALSNPEMLSYQLRAEAERFEGKWRHLEAVIDDVSIWSDTAGAIDGHVSGVMAIRLALYFSGYGTKGLLLHRTKGSTIRVAGKLKAATDNYMMFDDCEFQSTETMP